MKLELHNEDCLTGMNRIQDESIDMIVCDLPYGLTQHPEDKVLPLDILWSQYNRIIKPNGVIALFGQGLFYVDLVQSNRSMFRYDLVWDKVLTSGFLNAKRMPLRQHEQIAIFYKSLPTYNPQFTQGKPLHGKGSSYLSKNATNQNYGKFNQTPDTRKGCTDKYPTSILRFTKPHPSKALHRTEKSVACVEWLIKTYTDESDTVLDNCMGCGTTAVACKNTNRNFIGFEIDEHYFNVTKHRIGETK